MAMTDKEKIEWFDATMLWVSALTESGTPNAARSAADDGHEPVYDLYFDVIDQYEKVIK